MGNFVHAHTVHHRNPKLVGAKGKVVSTRRETIDEVNQALSISPENPLCILHQEIAKTFLLNSNSKKKYQVRCFYQSFTDHVSVIV